MRGGTLNLEAVTIDGTNSYGGPYTSPSIIVVYGSGTDVESYSHLIVGEDSALVYSKPGDGTFGITVSAQSYIIDSQRVYHGSAYGVTVDFDGTIEDNFLVAFYLDDAVDKTTGNLPTFNIGETARSTGMIYAGGYGVWNIAGGQYAEDSPLCLKCGVFNISGSEFTATGPYEVPESVWNSTEPAGGAVNITSNDTYPRSTQVNITGGRFVSENSYALYEGIGVKSDGTPGAAASYAQISVSGGEFIGSPDHGAVLISAAADKNVITGGTFSSDVKDYLADGYSCTQQGDVWVVTQTGQ